MQPMRVVVITGAPGVGKTSVARHLIGFCPPGTAFLDTDQLADIHPWHIDERFLNIVGANLRACLENFSFANIHTVVVSGVIVQGGIYDQIEEFISDSRFDWIFYALRADVLTIRNRIQSSSNEETRCFRLKWLHRCRIESCLPSCCVIDTDALSALSVAEWIAQQEQFPVVLSPPDPDTSHRNA